VGVDGPHNATKMYKCNATSSTVTSGRTGHAPGWVPLAQVNTNNKATKKRPRNRSHGIHSTPLLCELHSEEEHMGRGVRRGDRKGKGTTAARCKAGTRSRGYTHRHGTSKKGRKDKAGVAHTKKKQVLHHQAVHGRTQPPQTSSPHQHHEWHLSAHAAPSPGRSDASHPHAGPSRSPPPSSPDASGAKCRTGTSPRCSSAHRPRHGAAGAARRRSA